MDDVHTAVLVEGESDREAVLTTAKSLGRHLALEGIVVVAMGGATNIAQYITDYGRHGHDVELVGLCDIRERELFEDPLGEANVFVCDQDLEDELVRAMGVDEMLAFIESQGELKRFRTMQKQPHQRDRSIDHHLYNYCGMGSGRKARYARGVIDWLPTERIPLPLRDLVTSL